MLNPYVKARKINQDIKTLKIRKIIYLKTNLFGLLIAFLIFLVPILILVNLLILWQFIFYTQIGLLLAVFGLIYMYLFFSDKALIYEIKELKWSDLTFLRNLFYLHFFVILIIIFIIYIIFFKWW